MNKQLHFQMRQEELAHLIERVEQGEQRALISYAEIKKMKEMYALAEKQIEPLAIGEAENYTEKTFDEGGFTFQKRNGATRYSYKNIPEWQTYNKGLKDCEERHKQAFISRQKGMLTATMDGEEIVMPEVSYSKDSLAVKKLTKRY